MRVKQRKISSSITDKFIAESESGKQKIGEYIAKSFDRKSLEKEGNAL